MRQLIINCGDKDDNSLPMLSRETMKQFTITELFGILAIMKKSLDLVVTSSFVDSVEKSTKE